MAKRKSKSLLFEIIRDRLKTTQKKLKSRIATAKGVYQLAKAKSLKQKYSAIKKIVKNSAGVSLPSSRISLKKLVPHIKISAHLPLRKSAQIMQRIANLAKNWIVWIIAALFLYYFAGSQISERIDVETGYEQAKNKSENCATVGAMKFLLLREIDDKMWTPNLPWFFPAAVLDNMPNFQIGIVDAVKNITGATQKLQTGSVAQKEDLKKAVALLKYSPHVWLLARQSSLKIAPSANTQYRKAAKYLRKYNEREKFVAAKDDLQQLLLRISQDLMKLTQENESYQLEHSADIFDRRADDLFYHQRGYAFALAQIGSAMGVDYKEIILQYNVYPQWTYFISSLKKAANFAPRVVRNGPLDSILTPNHLLMQNYYLMRAAFWAEKIYGELVKENGNQS